MLAEYLIKPFASTWRNPELFRRVLIRDIETSIRGSVLGLAWILVIPLALVAIYTFVFGVVLDANWSIRPRSKLEVPLIYFSGLMIFTFFMEVITRSTTVIRDHVTYVTKIVFPVDILSSVVVGTALFKFAINLVLLAIFMLVVTWRVPTEVLWLPLLMMPLVAVALGLSLIFAAFGAFVRDLSFALQAFAPVFMFICPVFYSIRQVPEQFRFIFEMNPLTLPLESGRDILFFDGTFPWSAWTLQLIGALIFLQFGHLVFRRLRPGFADVV